MSYVDTLEQNATVERRHQFILNIARALMLQAMNCVFFDYKTSCQGSVTYDLSSKATVVSRNVTFYEHVLIAIDKIQPSSNPRT